MDAINQFGEIAPQLQLYLQTQHNSRTEAVVSMESLLRRVRPGGQVSGPKEVLDLVERTGGWDLLTTATVDLLSLAADTLKGFGYDGPIGLNLDARQITPALLESLEAAYAFGLAPSKIELELTEARLVGVEGLRIIEETRRRGHRWHLDDVGAGVHGLYALLDRDWDAVKLDRAINTRVQRSLPAQRVVAAIIAGLAAHGTGLIMEGVETDREREVVAELGVECIQGYLYGRPAPAHVIGRRLYRTPKGLFLHSK